MNDKDKLWSIKALSEHTGVIQNDIRQIIQSQGILPYLDLGSRKVYDHRLLSAVQRFKNSPEYKAVIKQKRREVMLAIQRKSVEARAKRKLEKQTPAATPQPQSAPAHDLTYLFDRLGRCERMLEALCRELSINLG